jgi:DNA polymerase-3 subunit delta'
VALHFDTPEIVFLTEDEKGFTPNFAPFINGKNVDLITDELNKAISDIEHNANGRIVFLDLALKFSSMIKLK